MTNIDSALKEAPPEDIMTNKLMDEILYYITPIVSFSAFILIIIFGVIPNVNTMYEKIQAVDALKTEDDTLKTRIVRLEVMRNSVTDLKDVITKIDSIVPEGKTEVVKFSQRVREAIKLNMDEFASDSDEPEIKMNEIKTGELTLASVNTPTVGLKINQIPTEFNFTGGLGRFRKFFSNLYDGSDFFVVEKMQLSYNNINRTWNGQVSLVKYQFNKDATFNAVEVYGSVGESLEPNEKVVNFVKTKFLDNKLDTTSN
jgi:hypothetical protein